MEVGEAGRAGAVVLDQRERCEHSCGGEEGRQVQAGAHWVSVRFVGGIGGADSTGEGWERPRERCGGSVGWARFNR